MEQVRIAKEMRERDRNENGRADNLCRPRFMVWENVPGAFTSNKGRDFQAVLTEIARISVPEAPDVPLPDKGGWPKSGILYDELGRWSIAYRLHDAQFWGVPQRRKRIALVADFNGLSAAEILFDPQLRGETEGSDSQQAGFNSGADRGREVHAFGESLPGDSDQSGEAWKKAAEAAGGGADPAEPVVYGIGGYSSNAWLSDNPEAGIYEAATARTLDLNGGSPACNQGGMAILCLNDQGGNRLDVSEDKSGTLRAEDHSHPPLVYDARGNGDGDTAPTMTGDHNGHISDFTALCIGNGQLNQMSMEPVANTLDTMHDQQAVLIPDVAHAIRAKANCDFREDSETYVCAAVDCRNGTESAEVNGTLQAKEKGQNLNSNNVCRIGPVVRRLTPLECERLQGMPDGWTDIGDWTDEQGKRHKAADSPRYKALGNGIALPFWQWLARRICAQYERPVTMASLFDGIASFPLAFSRCGGIPVWASEIEPFPIAVAKRHFPDKEETT